MTIISSADNRGLDHVGIAFVGPRHHRFSLPQFPAAYARSYRQNVDWHLAGGVLTPRAVAGWESDNRSRRR